MQHFGVDWNVTLANIKNMITLSQVNQYAMDNNIGDDTDVFTILSQMQLVYENLIPQRNNPPISADSHVEWTTEEVLALFST